MTPLLQLKNVKKYFSVKGSVLKALNDITLDIFSNETLGLVGESGCGKTTLARAIMRFYKPTDGDILFDGKSIINLKRKKSKMICHDMQYIFQDPFTSLNPRMTIEEIIGEPMHIHRILDPLNRKKRIEEIFDLVNLSTTFLKRFPHELSGGQRQRVGIARALALNPRFIICDEPIAALDVSIQAQIINLLKKLQKEMDLTYLFISHDLGIVKYLSTRIAVMYLGHLMELASSNDLYANPLHPYTQGLLAAIPIPDPVIEKKRTRFILKGEIPSAISPPKGCVFCTRCPKAIPICYDTPPLLSEVSTGHKVACHLFDKSIAK